ncbi:asparagine synthase (glutamine-hydrolysing) [Algoriphagus boseongensis]|uniref:asparagine synthase (glutamine-hydrolyzing) n=1 Tax=Algoriphagus boseongensis TaxID=1442587 RepID=A0A4R6TC29_9BACT|nr:asparagine synthase (glutamine-hydrolyzing) [Algoriphagus boseongensis]TDQ19622.1 asparagine synthase (glutamine-hydrolysing) [Algoriphagus boseongensis]
MCGIAGIVGPLASERRLSAMLKTQAHRGPDNLGKWVMENQVAFGHNRLSILDLSDAANQPFHLFDGRYQLIFNGEIYNYLEIRKRLESSFNFKTKSDTEVLLYSFIHWGEGCLKELNGMFSFAIWDSREAKLFAARDRFGVKPFHYSVQDTSLCFSSEIPPLWKAGVPKTPKDSVWSGFFTKGTYGNPSETFWEGIYQLPAGHYLIYQNSKLELRSWYDFIGNLNEQPEIQPHDQEDYILQLLLDSVKLRFRADVPVGFNLSGGLDSSTLLALVSDLFPENDSIEAFTFITGDDRYDELFWVKEMLNGRPYPLNTCLLQASEVPDLTSKISELQAEPFGGIPTLAYSKVFKTAREKGILVLLDGQGSDEAWAGYDYYVKNSDSVVQGVNSSPVRPEALDQEFAGKSHHSTYPAPFGERLLNLQYRDLFYTKIPRALRFNDRVSMAHSTELREPFLDFRLVEYVFSRPTEFKIKNGSQKWLLRQIANKYLGDQIALAPKRPLQTPQREWLAEDLGDWVESQLEILIAKCNWFDSKVVWRLWNEYKKGDKDNSFYLWQWVNAAELLK